MRLQILLPFLVIAAACSAAVDPARNAPKPLEIPVVTIAAEPTSSLSHSEALLLAQQAAASLSDAYAVNISPDYFGNLSPAVPANAVLVAEGIKPAQVRVGDLLLCKINNITRVRRLMRMDVEPKSGEPLFVVGYEQDKEQVSLPGAQLIARVIGHFIYDPNSKDAGRVDRPAP